MDGGFSQRLLLLLGRRRGRVGVVPVALGDRVAFPLAEGLYQETNTWQVAVMRTPSTVFQGPRPFGKKLAREHVGRMGER